MSQTTQEARREYSRAAYAKHPGRQAGYARKSILKNPGNRLWSVAKQRAKRYELEFSIAKTDVRVPENCPVFGFPLVHGTGISGRQGGNFNSPSLDRIDSSKGYLPGNIQVISHLANSMKHAANKEQLLQFAEWVFKVYTA